MAWFHKTAVSLDQFLNVLLFNGHPGETISSRLGRAAAQGKWWGKAGSWILNTLSRGHTEGAEAGDLRRAHIVIGVEEQDEVIERKTVKVVELSEPLGKKPVTSPTIHKR